MQLSRFPASRSLRARRPHDARIHAAGSRLVCQSAAQWEMQEAAATYGTSAEVLALAYNLAMSYDGDKVLFDQLEFTIKRGQKLAVVGQNGCGKSTLLKVLAGVEKGYAGNLQVNSKTRIGYLPQDPQIPNGLTVLEAVLQSDSSVAKAVRQYRKAVAEAGEGQITKELSEAMEKMSELNGWEVDTEAARMLNGLGFPDLQTPVDQLSGGQKKRVALVAALLGRPDLLVLDEPTNHMDVDIISWMEQELSQQSMSLAMVTHDRYFMENVCDQMLELEGGRGYVHRFGGPGSWEQFKEAKEERRRAKLKEAQRAQTLLRTETQWMRKQPKARQAKSRAREDRYYQLTDKARDLPGRDLIVSLDGAMGKMSRQGNKVVTLKGVSHQADRWTILDNFSYEFAPEERIGIVGPNGAGKTTILDLIAGLRPIQSGERSVGETVVVGYFQQHPPHIRDDLRLIDYIREVADKVQTSSGEGWGPEELSPERVLEELGFPRARQYQKVESLSGGERRRLHLASVLVTRPNLLLLDEPTNDLDLQTVEVLERLLEGFRGTLVVVSHDRSFLDQVVDFLFVLKGDNTGEVELFNAGYTEYLEERNERRLQKEREEFKRERELERQRAAAEAAQKAAAAAAKSGNRGGDTSSSSSGGGGGSGSVGSRDGLKGGSGKVEEKATVKRRLGFYEMKEFEGLEPRMEVLSQEIDDMQALVDRLTASGDYTALGEASMKLADKQAELATTEARWLELAELCDGLE